MNHARSNDDALLDRLLAGTGSDVEADPRLPLVRTLVRAAAEPPAPAVEQRHLAAISDALRAAGHADPRADSSGRPAVGETRARRVPRVRLARSFKVAALAVATALALTGVVFASGGVPAPLRTALEEVGLLPEDDADNPRGARVPVGTASRRGPKSRCARGVDGSASPTPAVCGPAPRGGRREPAPSLGRAGRSERDGRSRSPEPGLRRREGTAGPAATPADSARARREASDSARGRSGSSPSRRGYAPVGGGRGRSSGGSPDRSEGRSSSAPRGQGQSRSRRPAIRERASAGARRRVERAGEVLPSG